MYVTHHKDMTRAVYRPLHPILLEEEHQHLELLKEEGQKGFAQLEKIRCQNLDRKRHLRMVYRELRKMCQKPDVELLLVRPELLPQNAFCHLQPTPLPCTICSPRCISPSPASVVEGSPSGKKNVQIPWGMVPSQNSPFVVCFCKNQKGMTSSETSDFGLQLGDEKTCGGKRIHFLLELGCPSFGLPSFGAYFSPCRQAPGNEYFAGS